MHGLMLALALTLLPLSELPDLFCVGPGCRAAQREAHQPPAPTVDARGASGSHGGARLATSAHLPTDVSPRLSTAQRELFEFRGQRALCANDDALWPETDAAVRRPFERVGTPHRFSEGARWLALPDGSRICHPSFIGPNCSHNVFEHDTYEPPSATLTPSPQVGLVCCLLPAEPAPPAQRVRALMHGAVARGIAFVPESRPREAAERCGLYDCCAHAHAPSAPSAGPSPLSATLRRPPRPAPS